PLATHPSWQSLGRTARLWGVVLSANWLGTFAFALYVWAGGVGQPALRDAMLEVSRATLHRDAINVFLNGIPAGFLIATLVW
ncbi:formate/nitrite transporter family protein, partial [Acinetobacter baumannii]